MDKIKCIDASNEQLVNNYEYLIEEREKQVVNSDKKYTVDDIILVRTTDIFPKNREIKPLISGSMISKRCFEDLESVLKRMNKQEISYELSEQLEFDALEYRDTVHFTENGLVQSHMQGNFQNRSFIILEPLNEQIGKSNFRLFAGQDTFIKGNMTLSEKAIIMLPEENAKDLILEYPELINYHLLTFKGDEQQAVRMALYDLGYLPEYISNGYITESSTSHLIVDLNRELAQKYDCIANTKHVFTPEYKEEVDNRIKLYCIFERECVKFLVNELISDDNEKQKILNDLDVKEKNDTEALYNLDCYDKDILIETIKRFNETVEVMKNNGVLPRADEVLDNPNIGIYNYYVNNLNLQNKSK